jgi:hypothetical protein
MKRFIAVAVAVGMMCVAAPALAHGGPLTKAPAPVKYHTDLASGWTLSAYAPQCNGGGFVRGATCHGSGLWKADNGVSAQNWIEVCYSAASSRNGPWSTFGCDDNVGGSARITANSKNFILTCNVWYRTAAGAEVKKGGTWLGALQTSIAVRTVC